MVTSPFGLRSGLRQSGAPHGFFACAFHSFAGATDEIDVFDDDNGRLKMPRKLEVLVQKNNVLCSDEERGVVWKLSGQVLDGVSLACSGRTIEEQSFFDGKAEALQVGSLLSESGDVALK